MAKQVQIVVVWCLALAIFLTGCQVKKLEGPEKTELPFTVAEPDSVPAELQEIIQENKEGELRLTYRDGEYLWLVRGYGRQKTGGYSIAVNGVYEMEEAIHVDTTLIGPDKNTEVSDEPSYPYVALKIKRVGEGEAVFD